MADSTQDTLKHRGWVKKFTAMFCNKMLDRAERHDESKLHAPEKEMFDQVGESHPLGKSEFGSAEYAEGKKLLGPALDHHYAENDHHPQHFHDGIAGMNLYQLLEMYLDWHAASKRNKNGSIIQSVDHNIGEFKIEPQLAAILMNTARLDSQEETDDSQN